MKTEYYRFSGNTCKRYGVVELADTYDVFISDATSRSPEVYSTEVEQLRELHKRTGKHYALAYRLSKGVRLEVNIGEPSQMLLFNWY